MTIDLGDKLVMTIIEKITGITKDFRSILEVNFLTFNSGSYQFSF